MASVKSSSNSISLQDRDIALLRGLFESRIMTAEHVSRLFFDGRDEATKKRLQKLKSSGLIGERPRKAFEPAVLFLTRKGLTPLSERGVLREYPEFDLPALERRARVSPLTVRHELEVMDVKTALASRIPMEGMLSLVECCTWPLLNEFMASSTGGDGAQVLVRPDGFIRIHEKEADGSLSEHAFFLEVDRSTETQETLVARAGCYLNYYRSGGFAEKHGGARSDFKNYPFRVLMVFKTAERRNNTAERLIQNIPPILTHVWLATYEEATSNPFGAIWVRPLDYRNALSESPFEQNLRRAQSTYQRQPARDQFINVQVKKLRLISEIEG